MANQVVKVKRDTIAACMTCPLCDMLLKDATTISECLHTFCRKCIYKKISDEGVECCPICNIDLGCVPLEKLRPDHNLQDVRAKIFPFKRRKVEAPEVTSSVILPVRRKERSLSSLVVNAPKVSAQTTTTGRRTRPVLRKATALRISNFPIEKRIKKEDDPAEDHLENSSSPETVNKFNQNTKQNSSSAEASLFAPNNEAENGAESWDGKSDLWQPLNCLVEVANRSKSFKSIQVSDAKQEATQGHENEPQVRKTKFKEEKLKVEDEKNNIDTPSDAAGPKRLRRIRRKKAANFGDSGISSQAVLNAASVNHEKRAGPVWFSLVASEDQEGDAPLPQIPANYLRIKLHNTYSYRAKMGQIVYIDD
ncbi:E3 ubiquitin protein ligase DRIP2 isoform X2 [Ricinus communis]|uniref:E3 ubiquitin protein ligase DRIP2 isoform X2 n=1 Tax=Ricinus communis TaxID=3988 RepID=UPI000772650E|nr:E3 ubiquitin protein ligase DRIP2 isoform X2 [Ricinus communis]|eukprot:XP_015575880.1 E3 ubiquitin protein ligase DRIP2 isoform X2 [Ricinus communis]